MHAEPKYEKQSHVTPSKDLIFTITKSKDTEIYKIPEEELKILFIKMISGFQ